MPPEGDDEPSPFDPFLEPDTLPVFVERWDDREFRIAPRFDHGRLRWAVRVTKGTRILYDDVKGLDADAAERFDVDEPLRERLNEDRKFVHRRFPRIPVQGNRELVEYPLETVDELVAQW